MEVMHQKLSRYTVFSVESESEALGFLQRASAKMYELPPELLGFSEEGFLQSRQLLDEESDDRSGRQNWEEIEDETIYFSKFERGFHLLTIELFNDFLDPADPLHADNIALAKHLEMLCQKPA